MNYFDFTPDVVEECWRPVDGFPLYEVSDLGRVRKHGYVSKNGHNIKPKYISHVTMKNGYVYVNLFDSESRQVLKRVHRLVAEAFISENCDLPCVNHKDKDKKNNCVSNLEWCTHKYNVNYKDCQFLKAKALSKRVDKIDRFTGEVIETYDSEIQAAKMNGLHQGSISACVRGRLKTTGGYKWKFSKDVFAEDMKQQDMM